MAENLRGLDPWACEVMAIANRLRADGWPGVYLVNGPRITFVGLAEGYEPPWPANDNAAPFRD